MTDTNQGEFARPVVTMQVHIRRNETLPQFIARLKNQHMWQHGDTVIFLSQHGRYDTVRISRPLI